MNGWISRLANGHNAESRHSGNFDYLLSAVATSTATATVHPTMGLFPIPRNPIISTWAGTDDEPANCASECMRPMVSVRAWVVDSR